MPWGLTRFHHFCCHRHRLFTADASTRIFESASERVRRSFRPHAYGYVVMPEHVHLLLSEPVDIPTQAKTGLEWGTRPFYFYSYRSASIGSRREALMAGSIPLTTPTNPRMAVDASNVVKSMVK